MGRPRPLAGSSAPSGKAGAESQHAAPVAPGVRSRWPLVVLDIEVGPARKRALRVSGRSEGVEEDPVGFAGVEQGSDPVVGEVGEPERGLSDSWPCAETWDEGLLAPVGVIVSRGCLASGGREPPPPALSEPYVTVSRHTAPTVRRSSASVDLSAPPPKG